MRRIVRARLGRKKEDKQHSVAEICRIMGISKPTLYSYLEETNG